MPVSLSRETSTGEAGVFKISVVPVVRPDDQAASADFNVFLGWLGYYSDQDSSLQYSERYCDIKMEGAGRILSMKKPDRTIVPVD